MSQPLPLETKVPREGYNIPPCNLRQALLARQQITGVSFPASIKIKDTAEESAKCAACGRHKLFTER